MDAKFFKQIVLTAACLLVFGSAFAEVVQHAGIPNTTGGKFINCRNPFQTLGIVRAKDATIVFQTRATGVQWEVRLPPMISEYDQYYPSPDGSAAVVALSPNVGKVFLVSGDRKPIVLYGAVGDVDFQGNRVLIATADRENSPYRVRVYQLDSGELVGDTSFEAEFGDGFRYFLIRLAGDGQSYYYIDQTPSQWARPVVRDVVSGQQRPFDYAIPGGIEDMLLYSKDRGYVVAGGKLYALGDNPELKLIPHGGAAPVMNLIESDDSSIQPVQFAGGWGVFHTGSSKWLTTGRWGSSFYSRGSILTVVNMAADSRTVQAYDFSGLKPKLVRSIRGSSVVNNSIACANEFGLMSYEKGGFVWHRLK